MNQQLVEDISLKGQWASQAPVGGMRDGSPHPTACQPALSILGDVRDKDPQMPWTPAPCRDWAQALELQLQMWPRGSPGLCCLRFGRSGSGLAGAVPRRGWGFHSQPPPGPGTGAAPRLGPGGADSCPLGTCQPKKVPSVACRRPCPGPVMACLPQLSVPGTVPDTQ